MARTEERRFRPSQIGYVVLQADPEGLSPELAARAVRRYLARKRPALAEALEVAAEGPFVVARATGEAPEQMLHEAEELLRAGADLEPEGEVEVAADQFAVTVPEPAEEPLPERLVLHSIVRYFPYPVCEWFEMTTGELTLTDRRITYEPEYVMLSDEGPGQERAGTHDIPLADMIGVERGEWWTVPCLLVRTAERTLRYGWPAERGELDTIFDVDEWLIEIRNLRGG
jgi:hypothetical protein